MLKASIVSGFGHNESTHNYESVRPNRRRHAVFGKKIAILHHITIVSFNQDKTARAKPPLVSLTVHLVALTSVSALFPYCRAMIKIRSP